MRVHDQTSRRVLSRARSGLILVAVVLAAQATARGQDAPGDVSAPARAREPIDLAARRVRFWNEGDVRWVHLEGRAAVFQGVEGVRADEAVVRVVESSSPGGTTYRVDLYAEVRPPDDGRAYRPRPIRTSLTTDQAVRLKPYERDGHERLAGAPGRLPILARSGLLPAVVATVSRTPVPAAERLANAVPANNPAAASTPARSTNPTTPTAANNTPAEVVPATQAPEPAVEANPQVAPVVELPDLVPSPARRAGPVDQNAVRRESPRPGDQSAPAPVPVAGQADAPSKADPALAPTQFPGQGDATDDPVGSGANLLPPALEAPPLDQAQTVPRLPALPEESSTADLPAGPGPAAAPGAPGAAGRSGQPSAPAGPIAPILPGSQRVTRLFPRGGGPPPLIKRGVVANGVEAWTIRGGVNIVTQAPQIGIIDISADSVIIWRKVDDKGKSAVAIGPGGEQIDDPNQPLEFYLEGNVVVRQDERKVAGNGDQKTYRGRQVYYNALSDRCVVLDGEIEVFAPGLVAPMRVVSPRIEQFRPFEIGPGGRGRFGLTEIRADQAMGTGSRFANPGYKFTSKSVDLFRVPSQQRDPNTGKTVGEPGDPNAPEDLTWRIDARQNFFYMGPVPVFYWPRFAADADDLEPPLRQFTFRTNNYFGQQILADFNGFRLLGIRKPVNVDIWNVDLDYLSARTKRFPALGSEIGWFGHDLINDLSDPYGRIKGRAPSWTNDYFGYFDIWGLRDFGRDVLGSGPAVITNNNAFANKGFQRGGGGPLGSVPPFQDFRGRAVFRHMQRFLPDDDEHSYEDFRAQLEFGYISDRHFLEEYYKRLFDVGMDQETVGYVIRSKQNWAWTVWAEANLQNWYTDTQWLPRLDYYRLGDSLFTDTSGNGPSLGGEQIYKGFTWYQHSGVDYANTHTAAEVNNRFIFAFMPYDPISNTSGVLKSFRAYTNQEVDMPLNFGNVFRLVPYVQGQAVGWSQQINGESLGRVWGAAGARAEVMAWKVYPWVQSELLNVHGLNHKMNLEADARFAYSNQHLDSIGVQDDLDDNTYEFTRRYFALTNYAGGLLPPQYDPRHLLLRRTLSPITGPTDIQNSINSVHIGFHQRLQTKRGPEGKRRIIDYMTLDLDTTYFPTPSRDNFGKPFGQNMYNWQWFLGDRTSFISYGWFELFKITGNPIYKTNIDRHNDPFGLNVVTSGFNLTRPPRGNVFLGYSVINTGPINTSALNVSTSYWLSPKWYGTFGSMYDFGNAILLSSMFSITRIGADYLTSIGLTVDPQRQSYMFAFQISPRLSPNVKFGSGVGLNNFDSRYAPTQ